MSNRIVRVILRGDIADLQAKMAVAAKSIADTADKATGASKASQEYRKHLSTLGTTAGAVGLAAAAGLGLAVAAAARFDSSMSKVQAATNESAGNMDKLRAAAIKAGADTVFSATEAADAITAMAKAGVSSKDILGGGLKGALALASAGELDVASAADIAATAMNQFGLAGKDIPHIADLLAAGASAAQGEVTDFAAALKFVGPVAHQMGISIEETTGTIAELASQGILGEQAGTSLRGMLSSLTSPSALAAKEMQKLGISLYDATGRFVGFDGVAGQLHDTMGNLTNAERDQALGRIFGNEQITAARILYAGGADAVEKWTKSVERDGAATDIAAIKMNNLQGDLEQLKGSLETAFIGLGEGDQSPLRGMVQDLTHLVNGFNNLPGPAKQATTALLGITAVTGGGLWFGTKVISGIADARKALEGLGVEGKQVTSALKGVAAAGAAFTVLSAIAEASDQINRSMDRTIPGVERLTSDLLALGNAEGARALAHDIGDIGAALQRIKDPGVLNQIDSLYGKIPLLGKVSQTAVPAILGFGSASQEAKAGLREAQDAVTGLDTALANIVQTGSAEQARATFDQLAATYGLTADQQKQLLKLMPQYAEALAGSSNAATLSTGAVQGSTQALSDNAAAAAADAEALKKARDAATETAHQFAGLGDKLNDSKTNLDGWIKDLAKQAQALRDFTKNLQTAAKKGLDEGLIASLEQAGPEGALRMKQLADASEKEIRRANRAWDSQTRAVDHYTNVVGGVPPAVTTTLTLNVGSAEAMLARINREIRLIPREWRTDYFVVQHGAVSKRPQVADAQAQADGGTVHRAAAGWTVAGPRYPYGDKVLTYLAPGEEVITNRHGEADRFRADRAAGLIPNYAAGTPVATPVPAGSTAHTRGGSRFDYRTARDAHVAALRTVLREMPVQRVPRDLMDGMAM